MDVNEESDNIAYGDEFSSTLSQQDYEKLETQFSELAKLIKNDPEFFKVLSSPQIGKYLIRDLISDDGRAVVFSAFDPDLNRQVVIKTNRKDAKPSDLESLRHEGRILSQLDSPNIVRCIAIEEHESRQFLVLEHVNGRNIAQWLDRHTPDLKQTFKLVRGILAGLEDVHSRGLLHLDLKPQNIIVTDDETAKLIDFGMSQQISELSYDGISGTLAFLAPEVANNHVSQIDQRTDVFGVGSVLYFLITAESLYRGESRHELLSAAQTGEILAPSKLNSDVPRKLEELCLKCLRVNPNHRFQSILELEKAFEQLDVQLNRSPKHNGISSFKKATICAIVAVSLLVGVTWLLAGVFYPLIQGSSNQPQDPSKLPGLKIPSAENIANSKHETLPAEIDLTIGFFQQKQNGDFGDVAQDNKGTYQLDVGSTVRLVVSPKRSCWVAVYNYESTGDRTPKLVFPKPKNEYRLDSRDELDIEFEATLSPTGQKEYLLIVAFATKWDPNRVEEAKVLTPDLIESVKEKFRGLDEKNGPTDDEDSSILRTLEIAESHEDSSSVCIPVFRSCWTRSAGNCSIHGPRSSR